MEREGEAYYMSVYIIEGGVPLQGEIAVHGAKNAALPVLAAALLPPESHILACPSLTDTAAAMDILRALGCRVTREQEGVTVDTSSAQQWEVPERFMREMRSSIIFLGAILARFGRARVSFPGGCELGPRPIDLHLAALEKMGTVIQEDHGCLDCTVPQGRLHGAEIFLALPSVGATQNVMIAASTALGRTILHGAAKEPEIDDLAAFLRGAGARIYTNSAGSMVIDGVEQLHSVTHRVMPDRIAAATYLCCAAAAGGNIVVRDCVPGHLQAVLPCLEQAGCRIQRYGDAVGLRSQGQLHSFGWVRTMPYPGFPTDVQAPLMAVATLAKGTTVFTETIFENRFRHAEELRRMGAKIRTEGRVAIITGAEQLHSASVVCTDLRGGAALCIAALAAQGQSRVAEIRHIERGYEHLDQSLRSLGANITRSRDEKEEETHAEQNYIQDSPAQTDQAAADAAQKTGPEEAPA